MRRTLVLKKESLAELTAHEMRGLAGAAATADCQYVSEVCIRSYDVLCLISRAMYPCPTDPTMLCD